MRKLALALLPACYLPVATGAPEPATTVGAGKVGFGISGELPTIDLVADNSNAGSNANDTQLYGTSPAASMRLTLAIGLTDSTDVEIAGEGELFLGFLPLPLGGSLGLRQQLPVGDLFDVAIAARIGGVSTGSTTTVNGRSTSDDASAYYGAFTGVIQLKHGLVRPLLSVQAMPYKATRGTEGDPVVRFTGMIESATFGLMFATPHVEFGPYITATHFTSEAYSGGSFASYGLMATFRRDRNAPEPLAAPPPVYIQGPPQ